jgi:hypothetical protein
MTWLRRNMIAWRSISAQEMESIDRSILPFIDP